MSSEGMTESTGNYTVLARRFRPQAFAEVIGQEHVAQALKNAISAGRVAHAYLFTGARGVGKTSMARILAKTLNCPNTQDGNPCNTCEICEGISEGRDVDILEIDGASNRGIDDIRMLRSNVNVKSMRTKYKIYIIDEVHMLTKEAFNALLKTLEEPPPGVKFVFCTTEPQKLPDTILSRCQRFDFSSIELDSISMRLRQIAEIEGFKVAEEAIELVARRAGGSMRDSQSLFDQLLAFGGEEIVAADVHRLLGTADDERLMTIVEALVKRERKEVLEQLESALTAGVQLSEFVDQLLNYLRDLMVLAARADKVPLLSVADSHRQQLEAQAKHWGLRTVLAGLEILAEAKSRMFRASHARSLVELALVRLTMLQDLQQMETLITMLQSGQLPNVALPAAGNAPTPATSVNSVQANPVQKKSLEHNPVASAVVEQAPDISEPTAEEMRESRPRSPEPSVRETPKAKPTRTELQSPDQPKEEQSQHEQPIEEPVVAAAEPIDEATSPQAEVLTEQTQAVVKEPVSTPTVVRKVDTSNTNQESTSGPLVDLKPGNEARILAELHSAKEVSGMQQVRQIEGVAISGPNRLDLIYPAKYDFVRQSLSRLEPLTLIQNTLSRITGHEIRVEFQPAHQQVAENQERMDAPEVVKPKTQAITTVSVEPEQVEDEFVKSAIQVFGCTSLNVRKMLPSS